MAFDGTLKFDTSVDGSGFQEGINKIGSLAGKGISAVGKIMTGAATAISGMGAAAIKVGSDFEASMSQVSATMGVTKNTILADGTKPFEILSNAAKEAGETTQFSASEAAEALNYLALAGYDAGTAAEVLPSVLNLAAAGGLDLAYASDLATDAMSALGIEASNENLTEFGDKMAVTAQKSNTSVSQLGEAILTVGATAKDMAGGTTELNTALGILADSGIKGSEGGTHLRNVLKSLQTPTDAAKEALAKYTKGVYDAEGNMRPLNEVLGELNTSLSEMTQQGRTEVINTIFNSTDLAAAQVLLAGCTGGATDLSAAFGDVSVDLTSFNGNMQKAMNICNQTMVAEMELEEQLDEGTISLDEYNAQYEALFENAYEALGPLKDVGVSMNDIENAVNSGNQLYLYASAINSISDEAERARYAEAIFGDSVSDLAPLLESGITDMDAMRTYAEELGLELESSGNRFDELSGYIEGSDGAMQSMADTMNDNLQGDIKILQSALEGLGISVYENVDNPMRSVVQTATDMVGQLSAAFKEGGFDGLVSEVGNILSQILEKIASSAPQLVEMAGSLIHSFCEGLKSATGIGDTASVLITSIVSGLFDCAGELVTTGIALIGKMAEGIASGAPQMVTSVSSCITDIVECIVDWLPDIINAGAQIVESIASGIADMLPTLMVQAVNLITTIATSIVDNLPSIIESAIGIVQALIDGLIEAVPLLLEGAVQFFQGIIDAIPVVIEQLLQSLPDIITSICDFLAESVPQLVESWIQLFMGVVDAIPTIVQSITDNLPQIITAVVDGLINSLPQILEAAITMLMAIIDAIPEIVIAMAESLPEIILTIETSLIDAMPKIFSCAKDLLWQIIKAVPGIVVGIAEAVPEIISGIVNGLTGGISSVFDAACELVNGIWEGIQNAWSPFGDWFNNTVSDLVENISKWFSELPDKILTWLTDVITNIKNWGQNLFVASESAVSTTVSNIVGFFAGLPEKIGVWLNETITSVENFFAGLPEKIAYWLGYAIGTVIKWGTDLYNWAATEVPSIIQSIADFFAELPGKIWTWLTNVIADVIQWESQLLSNMTTAATNAINAAVNLFAQLPEKIQTWLTSVITKVQQWAVSLAAKATEAAQGFVDNIINGIKGLPDKMEEIGSNIVSGIWNGISSGWNWLTDKVKKLANSLLDGVKDALGIQSPSKVFADEVGSWIPPGIGVGIDRNMPELYSQTDDVMEELAARMQAKVAIETGSITVKHKADGEHKADTEHPVGGGDTYIDEHVEMENTYNVPVVTPSEVSRANRKAARDLLGGTK